MMKALITGATGFIGRNLISRLSGRYELFAIVRDAGQFAPNQTITPVVSDLSRPLDHGLLPGEVDVVLHLAQANVPFPESADELFAVNTGATQQLLDYGRRAGARRFLLASSGDVYGKRRGTFKETDACRPASYYAATKQASEILTIGYSDYLQPCILRLFQPYGPGQTGRLIPKLAARIRERQSIQLNNEGGPHVSPLFIDDVAWAIEHAMAASYCGVLNIAGSAAVSMRELAEEIGRVLSVEPSFSYSGEEAVDLSGDNGLMKNVLGAWPMVALADGLARTFQSEEGTGWQTGALSR